MLAFEMLYMYMYLLLCSCLTDNITLLKERTPSRWPSGNNQSGTLSVDQQRKYNDLVMKAKTLATNGSIREALECNKKALAICFSEKLNKRIQKMEVILAKVFLGKKKLY